jgi:hypothetical protein
MLFGRQYHSTTDRDVQDFENALSIVRAAGPRGNVNMDALDDALAPIVERHSIPVAENSVQQNRHGNSVEDLRLTALGFAFGEMSARSPAEGGFRNGEERAAWIERNLAPPAAKFGRESE